MGAASSPRLGAGRTEHGVAAGEHQPCDSTSKPTTLRPFIAPLRAICRGSRDPALADAPDLDYSMAAEIRLLIGRLG